MKTTITENGNSRVKIIEHPDGTWKKYEYIDGKLIYYENSNRFWMKREYYEGYMVYTENSNNFWERFDYIDGNLTYYENSNKFWVKYGYYRGDRVYYEDSNGQQMHVEQIVRPSGEITFFFLDTDGGISWACFPENKIADTLTD
jgi:hypothetical protein